MDRRQQIGVGRERENSRLIICPSSSRKEARVLGMHNQASWAFPPPRAAHLSPEKPLALQRSCFTGTQGECYIFPSSPCKGPAAKWVNQNHLPQALSDAQAKGTGETQSLRNATGLQPTYQRSSTWGVRTRASYAGRHPFTFLDQMDGVTLGNLVN